MPKVARTRHYRAMFCDIALAYDPATRRADMVFDGRNFVIDTTAATALMVSIGTERRAAPDDILPGTYDDNVVGGGRLNPRRGWVGDGLDGAGKRIGSRLWLLDDAKQTPETRLSAIDYATEATAWMPDATGVTPSVDASWIRPNVLAVLAQAGGLTLTLPVSLV